MTDIPTQIVRSLRNLLYDVMTASTQQQSMPDIHATQQLGVNLSNSVKKDGVTIVQMQNVVGQQVVQKVTEALKLIDGYEYEAPARLIEQPKQVVCDDLVERALGRRMSLKLFLKLMEEAYCREAVARLGEDDARQMLRVKQARLQKLDMDDVGDL